MMGMEIGLGKVSAFAFVSSGMIFGSLGVRRKIRSIQLSYWLDIQLITTNSLPFRQLVYLILPVPFAFSSSTEQSRTHPHLALLTKRLG